MRAPRPVHRTVSDVPSNAAAGMPLRNTAPPCIGNIAAYHPCCRTNRTLSADRGTAAVCAIWARLRRMCNLGRSGYTHIPVCIPLCARRGGKNYIYIYICIYIYTHVYGLSENSSWIWVIWDCAHLCAPIYVYIYIYMTEVSSINFDQRRCPAYFDQRRCPASTLTNGSLQHQL